MLRDLIISSVCLIGSVATGDLNFTSIEPRLEPPPQRPEPQLQPPSQRTVLREEPPPQRTEMRVESLPQRSNSEQSNTARSSEHNGMTFVGRNPFSSGLDGIESIEVQSTPSIHNLEDQHGASGKKRKQSQMAAKLGEFIEFRKNQIEKNMEKLDDKKKQEDDYSVEKCIDMVEAMEGFTDEEKADANELFQSAMNRQIFVKTKNPNVRLIWVKKKICQVCSPSVSISALIHL